MCVTELSKKFYELNRGGKMHEEKIEYFNEALSQAEWYETYDEAFQAVKNYRVKAKEWHGIDVCDIALAPPDYGAKRYCTHVNAELLVDIIGFKYLDEYGNPIPESEPNYYGTCRKNVW